MDELCRHLLKCIDYSLFIITDGFSVLVISFLSSLVYLKYFVSHT